MSEAILVLDGVHTDIGRYHILYGISFSVPRNGVYVLLGRNGAGKTTTLRTIMGLWRARQGSILFAGTDIAAMRTADISRLGIAYVPENMGIFGGLTVEENLLLATANGRFDASRLARVHDLFPAMKQFWEKAAWSLSGGQKQMLAISRAIIEPRRLILIDEPTKGLAPAIVANMVEVFRDIAAETTVLLVEQNFAFASALGQNVAVVDDGKIAHRGSMQELLSDAELQTRLLSLSLEAQH